MPDGRTVRYKIQPSPFGDLVEALLFDREGRLWITHRGGVGLIVFKPDPASSIGAGEKLLTRTLAGSGCGARSPDQRVRLPAVSGEVCRYTIADGLAAVTYVRQHASEWKISRDRVGIIGFSAGGRVTAGVAFHYSPEGRPAFVAPIYAGGESKEVPVPADAPPLFIVIADDDPLISPNSAARLYMVWHAAGKPAELHIFRHGGHGFGMKTLNSPTATWIDLFYGWMQSSGFVPPQ